MQVATPGGMGMPAFYGPMLAPVTALAVTSLADFSARRAPGAASGATNEGLARQCFDRVRSALHSILLGGSGRHLAPLKRALTGSAFTKCAVPFAAVL